MTLILAACAPGAGSGGGSGLAPASPATVAQWAGELAPDGARRYDLQWTYQTQRGSMRGRAAARFVPPDSLRFDYRGPFGQSGAAMFVGDRIVWSAPEEQVEQLIPVAPLFWAALGVVLVPAPGTAVRARQGEGRRIWQLAGGGDTLTYDVGGAGTGLSLEMRQAGTVIGTTEVEYAEGTTEPRRARIVFPASASLLVFTVEAIEPIVAVDPEMWRRP
jgi:hypothetical protein